MSLQIPNDPFTRRKLLWITGAAGLSLVLPGCGGHGRSSSAPYSPDYTYRFPNSVTDGRLLVVTSTKGDTVTYFADKDSRGHATNLRAASVATGGTTNHLYYDPDGKVVTRMVVGNGVTYELNWTSPTTAVLKMTHPATGSSISTPLNFSTKGIPRKTVYSARKRPTNSVRRIKGRPSQIKPRDPATGNCIVNVTHCGQPDPSYVDVYVAVYKHGYDVAYATYPAFPTGTTGEYVASIPKGNATIVDLKQAALDAISVLENGEACNAWGENNAAASLEYFCASVAAAIASVPDGFNQIAALAFLEACTIINVVITLTCEALETPAGKLIVAALEKALEEGVENIDLDLTGQIDLTAEIAALPTSIIGSTATASVTGPFPNLTASAGIGTEISGLILDPSSPVAGESYVATVTVLCLTPDEVVTMHILGTDGYEDSVTYNVDSAALSQEFNLYVPGAVTGVRDTVNVTVSNTGKDDLHTSAFLIFQ